MRTRRARVELRVRLLHNYRKKSSKTGPLRARIFEPGTLSCHAQIIPANGRRADRYVRRRRRRRGDHHSRRANDPTLTMVPWDDLSQGERDSYRNLVTPQMQLLEPELCLVTGAL